MCQTKLLKLYKNLVIWYDCKLNKKIKNRSIHTTYGQYIKPWCITEFLNCSVIHFFRPRQIRYIVEMLVIHSFKKHIIIVKNYTL